MKPPEALRAVLGERDLPHLEEAFTHPSFGNENRSVRDYQRLEFLGDSVLQLTISERLFTEFPEAKEGELSFMRASIVSTDALARLAHDWGIGPHIRVGRGAAKTGDRLQASVLCDVIEATLGAIYLDAGFAEAARVCGLIYDRARKEGLLLHSRDAKSELQERCHALRLAVPVYRLASEEGPDHERVFEVLVELGAQSFRGKGRSKKTAEQAAARVALENLSSPNPAPENARALSRDAVPSRGTNDAPNPLRDSDDARNPLRDSDDAPNPLRDGAKAP